MAEPLTTARGSIPSSVTSDGENSTTEPIINQWGPSGVLYRICHSRSVNRVQGSSHLELNIRITAKLLNGVKFCRGSSHNTKAFVLDGASWERSHDLIFGILSADFWPENRRVVCSIW